MDKPFTPANLFDSQGSPIFSLNYTNFILGSDGTTLDEILKKLSVSDIQPIRGKKNFPLIGNAGHLYIDVDSGFLYRWDNNANSYTRLQAVDKDILDSKHVHANKTVLDQTQHALTTPLKEQYDEACSHSRTDHAPVNAQKNIQSDWNTFDETSDSYIRNKPALGTVAKHNADEFATAAQGVKADSAVQHIFIGAAEQDRSSDSVYLPEITGAATTIIQNDLPGERVLASDSLGKVVTSSVTNAELHTLSGVKESIQAQFDTLNGSIRSESSRAVESETALQEAIDSEALRAAERENTLASRIESEQTRADAAEKELAKNLDDEAKRAADQESVLSAALSSHSLNRSNPHAVTKAQIGLGNVGNESKETMFKNPAFTGIPTAPTADVDTKTTQIATTKFVHDAVSSGIAASDAMIFKGTLGQNGTISALPAVYQTGWTYRVITAGTYAGEVCEIGDLITAIVSRTGTGNLDSDWTVGQTNIDGAVISTRKLTAGNGLTGGGDLSQDRTLHVGAGNGITVGADSIAVKPNTSGLAGKTGAATVDADGVGVVLGSSPTTAFRGDYGAAAYEHCRSAHARTDAAKVEASATNGYIKINNTETKVYSLPEKAAFGTGGAFAVEQNSGSYWQRIESIDNSTSGDAVFRFSQSEDNGSTFKTLLEIRDDETAYVGAGKIYTTQNKPSRADVGLGNVPNVTTDNQKPSFTTASEPANLVNGDTLSVLLGKISKAVSDFLSHASDTVKHVTSAERTKWNTVESKVDKVSGKALSSNDYTSAEKTKLGEIAARAEVNVQSDWNIADSTSDSYIKNKPLKLSQFTNDKGFITQSDIDTSQNHTHSNKTILDKINQSAFDSWNSTADNGKKGLGKYGVTGGTSTAFTAALAGVTLIGGTEISLRFHQTNAANATLNVNGLGAKPLYYKGIAVDADRTPANSVIGLVYDTAVVASGAWHLKYSSNTNNTVSQNLTTANADYRVLFSNTADDTNRNEFAGKSTTLKYNPFTGELKTKAAVIGGAVQLEYDSENRCLNFNFL